MIPVGALVSLPGFAPAVYVVERYSAPTGTDYRGRPQADAPELLSIVMVSHQASRKQLRRADLDAADDWLAFYSNLPLRTAGEGTRPDVVRVGTEDVFERYELQNVADYGRMGSIYIALAKRIE